MSKVVYVVINLKLTDDEPFDSIWENLDDAWARLRERKKEPKIRGWYEIVEIDLNRVVANDVGWKLMNPPKDNSGT